MKIFNFSKVYYLLIAILFSIAAPAVYAQQKTDKNETSCPLMNKQSDGKSSADCPLMKKEKSPMSEMKTDDSEMSEHHRTVMENGEKEMGFSQTATTHHFLLAADGGAIQVEANDTKDTLNRDRIRTHLAEIAKQFQNGIFTTPFAVHSQVPPGVPAMDRLKNEIKYAYEETERGARVRISTANPQALEAIHAFLKFQIEEHRTGDPTSLKE